MQYLNPVSFDNSKLSPQSQADTPPQSRQSPRTLLSFLLPNTFAQPFRDPENPSPIVTPPVVPVQHTDVYTPTTSALATVQVPTLRVTFLINMPTPDIGPAPRAEDEAPPPVVEFGVIDASVLSSVSDLRQHEKETVD